MANTLASLNKEYWSNEMQKTLFVENTAVFFASRTAQSVLTPDGKKYHKPILGYAKVGDYTKGTDISDENLVSSDESFSVSQQKYGSVYMNNCVFA